MRPLADTSLPRCRMGWIALLLMAVQATHLGAFEKNAAPVDNSGFSYAQVLGKPLADTLAILKQNGISTEGKMLDILGAQVFAGTGTGIAISLSEEGRVEQLVLNILPAGETGSYKGPVHAGLDSGVTIEQVIAKLGEPATSTEKVKSDLDYKYPVVGYRLKGCRLNFAFMRKERTLTQVTFLKDETVDEDAQQETEPADACALADLQAAVIRYHDTEPSADRPEAERVAWQKEMDELLAGFSGKRFEDKVVLSVAFDQGDGEYKRYLMAGLKQSRKGATYYLALNVRTNDPAAATLKQGDEVMLRVEINRVAIFKKEITDGIVYQVLVGMTGLEK